MTRVTIQDLRDARYCLAGVRPWFRRHGLDWQDFLAHGIEAFLDFPVVAGPIYRVLQAESLQPDSPFARFRREIYDALIALFDREVREILDREIDPLVYRGLIAAIEEISNHAMAQAGANERGRRRAREAAMLIMEAMVEKALSAESLPASAKS